MESQTFYFVRGNFFIPDAKSFWVKPSVEFLEKYLKANHYDVLVTTGIPHSLHLIGLGIKEKCPTKWIADFVILDGNFLLQTFETVKFADKNIEIFFF